MYTMLYQIFLILGILVSLGSLGLISILFIGYIKNKQKPRIDTSKQVTIVVPCKGNIPNLQKNLEGIIHQEYPNYRVVIILDSTLDPAFPIVASLEKKYRNVHVIFTEKNPCSSGKIAALLTGIKYVGETDIFVFADADILPHRLWLAYLVSPLKNDHIGATTGFRWFFPTSLKTTLIAAWNMATMTSLFLSMSNYAWGGSMAIRKPLFESLNIAERWNTGFSDDLLLTEVVKKAGYLIKFVPQTVAESPVEITITDFIRWGTQQFTWMRWYYPSIFYLSFCALVLLQILIPVGFIIIALGYMVPGILLILPIGYEIVYGLIGILVFRKLMNYPRSRFGRLALYPFFMPLIFLLYAYSLLVSSVKKEIIWAGRHYRKEDMIKK
ncbi:MAG: glycosyltransferase family 2 protein [Candidatus Thermoplasmatota archaeon]|nr:glycosyltransferase family 2 protein [Candidatus Thermoplasmatota archaeon]